MFPVDWGTRCSSRKRKGHQEPALHEDDGDCCADTQDFDICRRVLAALNKGASRSTVPEELNLDTLLSSLSYRALLCNMVGTAKPDGIQDEMQLITKAYEESFMREPTNGESQCASGPLCEGMFIDPTQPFVLAEVTVPGKATAATPNLCVLCSRKITQQLYYDVLLGIAAVPDALIQRYGNICGPGEYAEQCLLICPASAPLVCMLFPIMSHQRNRYSVDNTTPLKTLKQHKVAYEDFCIPSTKDQI